MSNATPSPTLHLKQLAGCPACDSASTQMVYDLGSIKISECPECGLHFLNPCLDVSSMAELYLTSQTLSEVRPSLHSYYEYGSLEEKSATLQEITRTLQVAEKYLPAKNERTLCEIGAGNGWFVAVAQRRGWQVTGLDSSLHNVEEAEKRFGVKLICSWFEEFNAAPESFDTVVLRDVLEHCNDPKSFLQKAIRSVKKGGLLVIAVPNHACTLYDLARFVYLATGRRAALGLRKWYVLEHTAYYTPDSLYRLMKRVGIDTLEYFQTSTDLARYRMSFLEKVMGHIILWLGKCTGRQTRLTMIGRKT